MNRTFVWPIVGWCIAVAITTTMDATGASAFSALPLFPLFLALWLLQRFSATDVAMSWGRSRALQSYSVAALYPVVVIGSITVIAALAGALHSAPAPHHRHSLWLTLPVNIIAGTPVALFTEEGFFRGWLWASLRRTGQGTLAVVLLTSVAFALWHWSSVILRTEFSPAIAQVPIFMINAVVIGAIWGMLRLLSGSLVVSSLSHSIWNALAYGLFGFGTNVGALGVANTALYGPEIGVLGLLLNSAFAAALLFWCLREGVIEAPRRGK
jgi:uncharacterized protein